MPGNTPKNTTASTRGHKACWIVVADGARARVFATDGPGNGLRSAVETDFVADNRKSRDIVTDRPGRFAGTGGSHHAAEPRVDSHQFEKTMFAREIADHVNAACRRGEFASLVLVAPPRTLGELRDALDDQARSRITAELGKDLTKVALRDLPAHLGEVMRL